MVVLRGGQEATVPYEMIAPQWLSLNEFGLHAVKVRVEERV